MDSVGHMGPQWTLLLLLLPFAQGAAPCDARQNNSICYGAVGGSIDITLMDIGDTRRLVFKRNLTTIWDSKKPAEAEKGTKFNLSTGKFQMFNLLKTNSNSYSLSVISVDGISNVIATISLIIEAPVSSVTLEPKCLDNGTMSVTCSAEGDSRVFSWTLDGEKLSKNDDSETITIQQDTEGLLQCSVTNHVSQRFETLTVSSPNCVLDNCTENGTQTSEWVLKQNKRCPEQTIPTSEGKTSALTPTTPNIVPTRSSNDWLIQQWPVLVGAIAGLLVFTALAIALFCVLKKKYKKKNEEEEQDLTYADVRIVQQPGRRPQQRAPNTEVEYGRVKFTKQSHGTTEAADNACIYAMVQK